MRVTHLHPTPSIAGGSEVSLQLAVRELAKRQTRSAIVCADLAEDSRFAGDTDVICCPDAFVDEPSLAPAIQRRAKRVMRAIAGTHPDVVHVHLAVRPAILDYIAQRWPTVYTAHVPVCPNGARHLYRERVDCDAAIGVRCLTVGYRKHGCGHLADGTPVSIPAFARGIRNTRELLRALSRCALVIAPSRWQAARLTADGLPSERIRVVHPPVQPCETAPAANPPVVAFAGRLVPFKGADHLIRASREIGTPHRLWMIGDGPQRHQLEELASTLGIRPRTHFHGALPPDEARRLLGRASVVAVPSRWGESFNLVGAQAAAGGISVVGYDVGGMHDWAVKYPHAVLVPPADYPAFVATLKERLKVTSKRPTVINHFSPEQHASALIRVYCDAVAGSDS